MNSHGRRDTTSRTRTATTLATALATSLALAGPAAALTTTHSLGANGPTAGQTAARAVAALSDLGSPTGSVIDVSAFGLDGWYQRFQTGTVVSSPLGTFTIDHGLEQTWDVRVDGWPSQNTVALGTIDGSAGYAAYFERPDQGNAARGAGYAKAGGVGYFVVGDLFTKFAGLNGLFGLGWPTTQATNATGAGLSGSYQRFGRGLIATTPSTGAHAMTHRTQDNWNPSSYGWPTSDTGRLPTISGSSGWGQYLTRPSAGGQPRGAVYARTGNPGYVVQGALFARFASLNGLYGPGWPTTNEYVDRRCAVWMQRFSRTGNLAADGRWCPATAYAGPYTSQAGSGWGYNQYPGYNGVAIYAMQRRLGMQIDKVTSSTWGPMTQQTLDAYLLSHGYPTTKVVNPTIWARLGMTYPFNMSSWVAPLQAGPASTRTAHINAAIAYARAQLGVDYLWGGTGNAGTPLGYDCSGFVLQALRAGGLNLTNVGNLDDEVPASDLSNRMLYDPELQVVSYSSLEPGDLLLYGAYDSGTPHAHHVALYIGGGTTIAAVGDHIQLMSLSQSSVGWVFLGVRRPFASASGVAYPSAATQTPLSRIPSLQSQQPISPLQQHPSTDTLWSIFSWATSLRQATTPVLTGSDSGTEGSWTAVRAGQRLTVTTAGTYTLVLVGGGTAQAIEPDVSGPVTIPAGVDHALLVPRSAAVGAKVGAPVTSHGTLSTSVGQLP